MSSTNLPQIGDHVGYVTQTGDATETRLAVVIGYFGDDTDLRLAVLDQPGANLDLMTMSAPADPNASRLGSWHRLASSSEERQTTWPEPAKTEDTTTMIPVTE